MFCSTLLLVLFSLAGHAQTPAARDILERAHAVERVDDQLATLTFTFSRPGKPRQQVIYLMAWKNNRGVNGYESKSLYFTDYPPEKRGIGYLGWHRPANSDAADDEWLYQPDLHTSRRISQRDRARAHGDDEFGNSLLQRHHLQPRPPHSGRHMLIGEQMLEGQAHYLVVSEPAPEGSSTGHGKLIQWVDTQTYVVRRKQYFDREEQQVLDVRIDWTQLDDYWIWQRVSAIDPRNQASTVLDISNIRINNGLNDGTFTRRGLEKGSARLR